MQPPRAHQMNAGRLRRVASTERTKASSAKSLLSASSIRYSTSKLRRTSVLRDCSPHQCPIQIMMRPLQHLSI